MIPIILYGKHDSRIVNEICGLLKEYGIIRVSDRRIESLVNSPRFLVVESKSTKVIEIPQGRKQMLPPFLCAAPTSGRSRRYPCKRAQKRG